MLGSPRLLKRSSGSLVRYVLRSGPLGIFAVGVVTLVNALLLYRSLQQQPTKSKANPADVPAARLQGQLDGRWAALHAAQVKRAASAPKWPALGGIRVLFLGDSITMGFANHPRWLDFEALGASNFGIGGDRTQHIAWRLANGLLDAHPPAVVVLMAGTNNLDSDDAAEVVRGVATILRLIAERWPAPATRVLQAEARVDMPLGIMGRNCKSRWLVFGDLLLVCTRRKKLGEQRYRPRLTLALDGGVTLLANDAAAPRGQPPAGRSAALTLTAAGRSYPCWATPEDARALIAKVTRQEERA